MDIPQSKIYVREHNDKRAIDDLTAVVLGSAMNLDTVVISDRVLYELQIEDPVLKPKRDELTEDHRSRALTVSAVQYHHSQ
jgi:hypothetical protein